MTPLSSPSQGKRKVVAQRWLWVFVTARAGGFRGHIVKKLESKLYNGRKHDGLIKDLKSLPCSSVPL